MSSPMQLTLKNLKKAGFGTWIAEWYDARLGIKHDLFTFADIVAYHPDGARRGVWLVQVTSQSNHSTRVKKILNSEHACGLLKSGARIAVISWKKKDGHWVDRTEEITLECHFEKNSSTNTQNGFLDTLKNTADVKESTRSTTVSKSHSSLSGGFVRDTSPILKSPSHSTPDNESSERSRTSNALNTQ